MGAAPVRASHLLALVLFAALVASVFALLARDERRAQARFGARVFAVLVGAVILFGWLMSRLPD